MPGIRTLVGLTLSVGLLVLGCDDQASTPGPETTDQSLDGPAKTPAQPSKVALDAQKVYPFMELKDLYQENWLGESKGNPVLDGSVVTLTGKVFGKGQRSSLVDGEQIVKGVAVRFRGGKFQDPDFGHDVECLIPADRMNTVEQVKKGDEVTVQGTLAEQEITIEGSFQYTTLKLKDCVLVR